MREKEEKKESRDKVKSRNMRGTEKWRKRMNGEKTKKRRKRTTGEVFFFVRGEFDIHTPFLIGNKAPL